MMHWNNFDAAIQEGEKPVMHIVAELPGGTNLDSFCRGVEIAVTALARHMGPLESIEVHEPGLKTIDLLRARLPPDVLLEQVEGEWHMTFDNETRRIIVLHVNFGPAPT